MKILLFASVFFVVGLQLVAQNKFRINGIGFDVAAIPAKYNSKGFNHQYPVQSSETLWARDVSATLSLYYNKKINLLVSYGYQWHTIKPQDTRFSSQTTTSILYKIAIGTEYKFFEKKRSKFIVQGLLVHENFYRQKSRFIVDENNGSQTIRKYLDFYGNGGNKESFELRALYSHNLSKHTRVFAGGGFNIGFYRKDEKVYYEGPPYDIFIPSGATYTLNVSRRVLERYFFLHAGLRTDIYIKAKKQKN